MSNPAVNVFSDCGQAALAESVGAIGQANSSELQLNETPATRELSNLC